MFTAVLEKTRLKATATNYDKAAGNKVDRNCISKSIVNNDVDGIGNIYTARSISTDNNIDDISNIDHQKNNFRNSSWNSNSSNHNNSTSNNGIISAIELSLGYEEPHSKQFNYVLKNFNVELQSGSVTALLGPSGVGKSSLLRVLAGLQKPQNGAVLFHGQPLKQPNPELGFVFQEHSLLPWLNLEENVAFGLDFKKQHKLSKTEIRQKVDQAINEVGLSHAKQRYPSELSGGMAQRASLARCLARSAEILLLDEPFSALDEITRAEMQQLLLTINKRRNTAAVLVTHDIDEALLVSDRILLIGGHPGSLLQDWQIDFTQPRELIDPALVQLRIEILQTLKTAHL